MWQLPQKESYTWCVSGSDVSFVDGVTSCWCGAAARNQDTKQQKTHGYKNCNEQEPWASTVLTSEVVVTCWWCNPHLVIVAFPCEIKKQDSLFTWHFCFFCLIFTDRIKMRKKRHKWPTGGRSHVPVLGWACPGLKAEGPSAQCCVVQNTQTTNFESV